MQVFLSIINALIPISLVVFLIYKAVVVYRDYLDHHNDVQRKREIQKKSGKRFRYIK